MTQLTLALNVPTPGASPPATPTDVFLRERGLPYEHRDAAGALRCRHHPDHAIPRRGAPCPACVRAGYETVAPQPDAAEGAPT